MSKKKNLIVFDIDGTLTDSVKVHQEVFIKSLHSIGVDKFNDKFGTYKHHTDSHIAKVIYETSTNKIFEKNEQTLFENMLYDSISKHDIKEIKGAKNIIKQIEAETDFGVCYATGSLFRPAKYKLEKIGIEFNSDLLIASDVIEEREKIVEKAIATSLKYYQLEKFERIISFGDGLWDLFTAKNLSLEFVGIGETNEGILRQNGMERYFVDFTKVLLSEL